MIGAQKSISNPVSSGGDERRVKFSLDDLAMRTKLNYHANSLKVTFFSMARYSSYLKGHAHFAYTGTH